MEVNKISCVFHRSVKFDSSKNNVNQTEEPTFNEVLKKEQENNIEKYALPVDERDIPPMLKYAVPPYYQTESRILKYAVPPIDTNVREKDLPPAPMYAIPKETNTK